MDLTIVRGLAYYTGFVFEAFERGRRSRALAGGGRYDHLVGKLGGPEMHAVGWAMGDVTMMDCLQFHGIVPLHRTPKSFFIVCEPETKDVAMEDLNHLRLAGVPVLFSYRQSGFGKQFKEADQSECSHVLVYGGDEIAKDEVICKRLHDRSELRISRTDLLAHCLSQV
jgi:histidyl-tRNA synthetase